MQVRGLDAAHDLSPADAVRRAVVADAHPRMAYHHMSRYPGEGAFVKRQWPTLQGQRRPRHHKVLPKRVPAAAVPIPTGPVHRNGLSPFSRNPGGVSLKGSKDCRRRVLRPIAGSTFKQVTPYPVPTCWARRSLGSQLFESKR
jgi:hypothetical protein